MSTLNYLCKWDISDEDCYKCVKQKEILFKCPAGCPYFYDIRQDMSSELLEDRAKLMEQLGVKDPFELGEPNT